MATAAVDNITQKFNQNSDVKKKRHDGWVFTVPQIDCAFLTNIILNIINYV